LDQKLNTKDPSHYIASFKSSSGCKTGEVSGLWTWFTENRWAMFVLFLVAGLFACFLGRYFLRPILFLTGVVEASFLCMLISYSTFNQKSTELWVGWVVLAVAVVIGLGVGFIFIKYQMVGAFCLSAWGGFSFGLLIYNAFLYKIESDGALWGFAVGFGVLYGCMVFFFFDHILIIATATVGSYLVCFGIGLVAGHYANPFTIVEMIHHG
jgi:hypothetical protein